MIRKGFDIFACSPPDDEALEDAREYIDKNELTFEDVKIMKNKSVLRVETKRKINLKF